MLRSFNARTRGQSVLEILEEEDFFMARRLPEGDDMDARRSFRVDEGHGDVCQEPQCDETLLSVREAIILEREGRTFEHPGSIDEVQPMILQV